MAPNLCRDLVVYVPAWKPNGNTSGALFDEEGDQIPELIPDVGIVFPTYIYIDSSFTLPRHRRAPAVADTIEHCAAGAPDAWSLQCGERYKNADYAFAEALASGTAPQLHLAYDISCFHECKCVCHKHTQIPLKTNHPPFLTRASIMEPMSLTEIALEDDESDADTDASTTSDACDT
ncbi:hypothetical protein C8R47DRAFT_1224820 [Mycena vitilis]|nr:hypothetical protein C8R47DRAFT_1224820 [Mycena vitilis]